MTITKIGSEIFGICGQTLIGATACDRASGLSIAAMDDWLANF